MDWFEVIDIHIHTHTHKHTNTHTHTHTHTHAANMWLRAELVLRTYKAKKEIERQSETSRRVIFWLPLQSLQVFILDRVGQHQET